MRGTASVSRLKSVLRLAEVILFVYFRRYERGMRLDAERGWGKEKTMPLRKELAIKGTGACRLTQKKFFKRRWSLLINDPLLH